MHYRFIIIIALFSFSLCAQDKKEDLKYFESGKLKARRIHTENHEKCQYMHFFENETLKARALIMNIKREGKSK